MPKFKAKTFPRPKNLEYRDLKVGDTFIYGEDIFIKTPDSAVYINDCECKGQYHYFVANTPVELIFKLIKEAI